MAERTVVWDGVSSFETSVPSIEVALREGIVKPVLTHYGGDFSTANLFRPKAGLPLARVKLLLGDYARAEARA